MITKRNKSNEVLSRLARAATLRSKRLTLDDRRIIAVSRTNYVMQLTQRETVFHLHYLVVQTRGQGCCYFDAQTDEPGIPKDTIGSDALKLANRESSALSIAALDAVYASIKGRPTETQILSGPNYKKADQRARIVCAEAEQLLRGSKRKSDKWTIALIGVVGSMVAQLAERRNTIVTASDFYREIMGKKVHGVKVSPGSESPRLVSEADVAIITGMTLANNTLPSILESAALADTKLVMFAETGANFAEEYVKMGIHSVVSEPFPFYLVNGGNTNIGIYRRGPGSLAR